MKIHIIGCSGSGKTYLAKKLSTKYGIPHFDLDDIQWDNHSEVYGVKMPKEKRSALFKEILANNAWIIEGVYYKWAHESFEAADQIYVLDMPAHLYKSRIILRFIKRKLGLQEGKKETLKSLRDLLRWTSTFQNENMKEIRELLCPYDSKVVWLSKKKEIKKSSKHKKDL